MKKDAVVALVAVLIVAAAAWGLAAVRPDLPNRPSQPFVPEKVVMRVNGEKITESEFNAFATGAPAEERAFYASREGRRMLADQIVKVKVLEREARRLGVTSDREVRAYVKAGISQMWAGRAAEKLVKETVETRLQAEYAKEKANAQVLRHILIAYEGGMVPSRGGSALPVEQAAQKAAALAARIRAGANFVQVAQQESDASSDPLPPQQIQQLGPGIMAALNNLQPGRVSDPIRTEFGIHLFMIDTASFEEMRPSLTQRVQRQVLEETVDRLQKAARVEMDKEFFPEPDTPPVPPPARSPKSSGQE